MPAPTLRDRILEIKSSPSTAETGVKALVKKMKEEFGDEVNAKIVRQHLEELEKTGTLRPSPTNNPVSPAASAPGHTSSSNSLGRPRILSSGATLHSRDLMLWPQYKTIAPERVVTQTSNSQLLRNQDFDTIALQVFEAFATAERNFLLQLSATDRRKIGQEAGDRPWSAAAHMRSHIEILMTLKGFKPCTLFAFYGDEGIIVFDRLVRTCLLPLMTQYQLDRYGFILQKIDHDVPTTVHSGFRNGWIFGDTRSGLWSLAEDVFLTPHPGCVRSEADVGLALGYPVQGAGRKHTDTIWYEDATEQEALKQATGEDVCCVNGFEFWAQDEKETCDMITVHFCIAQGIAKSAGHALKVDFGHHPSAGKNFEAFVNKMAAGR